MITTCFWNNLDQVRSKSNDLESHNLKVFESKKTKSPKQDCQQSANFTDTSIGTHYSNAISKHLPHVL